MNQAPPAAKLFVGISFSVVLLIAWYLKKRQYAWMNKVDFTDILNDRLNPKGFSVISCRVPSKAEMSRCPFSRGPSLAVSFNDLRTLDSNKRMKVAQHRLIVILDRNQSSHNLWVEIDTARDYAGRQIIRFQSDGHVSLSPQLQRLIEGRS